jgi:hypothetical protein
MFDRMLIKLSNLLVNIFFFIGTTCFGFPFVYNIGILNFENCWVKGLISHFLDLFYFILFLSKKWKFKNMSFVIWICGEVIQTHTLNGLHFQ